MKTKEELNALKEEVNNMNKKLSELSEDELKQVSGGTIPYITNPESNYYSRIEYERQKNKQRQSE